MLQFLIIGNKKYINELIRQEIWSIRSCQQNVLHGPRLISRRIQKIYGSPWTASKTKGMLIFQKNTTCLTL